MEDKATLRARDFWTALVLVAVALFFLWRTTAIPFFETSNAGVGSAGWYNSAALVPFAVFGVLLALALGLLAIAVRDGGAERAVSRAGLGWDRAEGGRLAAVALILFFYIFALVPRVDFIIASALLLTAMIHGFHGGHPARMRLAAACVSAAGLYALVVHFPRAEWGAPHDDDWVALAIWAGLTARMLVRPGTTRVERITPMVAVLAPLVLVMAMAFGFHQNVPNRGGLIFARIEYHYYVTLKPLWGG